MAEEVKGNNSPSTDPAEEKKSTPGGDEDKPAVDGAPLVKILEKDELKTAEEDEEVLLKE
jgi:hypothetical protein